MPVLTGPAGIINPGRAILLAAGAVPVPTPVPTPVAPAAWRPSPAGPA